MSLGMWQLSTTQQATRLVHASLVVSTYRQWRDGDWCSCMAMQDGEDLFDGSHVAGPSRGNIEGSGLSGAGIGTILQVGRSCSACEIASVPARIMMKGCADMLTPGGLHAAPVCEHRRAQCPLCLISACGICRICVRRTWKTLGVLERNETQLVIGLMLGCKNWQLVPSRGRRRGRSDAIQICYSPLMAMVHLEPL